MNNISDVLVALCGAGLVCGGVLGIVGFLALRLLRGIEEIPVIGPLGEMLFGGREQSVDEDDIQRPAQGRRARNLRDRLRSANQDFEQQLNRYGSQQADPSQFGPQKRRPQAPPATGPSRRQPAQPTSSDPERTRLNNVDPSAPESFNDLLEGDFGRIDLETGRRVRDGRYARNRGPENLPDAAYDDLYEGDSDVEASENTLGPVERRPLRKKRRDSRRFERNEDEIFGGMLDSDGDGYPDFF
jgi:hypothetical protein